MSLFAFEFGAPVRTIASILVMAVLAACVIAAPVQAVSLWQPADFSGTEQKLTGTVTSEGTLSIGPEGGFIPDLGLGVDIYAPGPHSEPLVQSPPSPLPIDANPVGVDSDEDGLPTGGPLIHLNSSSWFPEELAGFHIDFLNGNEIPLDHAEILFPIILGAPTSPPGVPGVFGADLDGTVTSWTFWQTGPTVFTDPGASHSEFFIPGVHVLRVDAVGALAGGLIEVPFYENRRFTNSTGLAGTIWSEHVDSQLATTLMGELSLAFPFDGELDIARLDSSGSGVALLVGTATISASYTLTTTVVPEPSSIVLFGIGVVGLCSALRRRNIRAVP